MMNKLIRYSALALAIGLSACTRIPTGEVGLRVNISQEVEKNELPVGSWNQTFIGSVLKFPVREIPVVVKDRHPLTADNSAMGDFDVTVVYNINPAAVAEIYSTKSKAFHSVNDDGEIYLLHSYIETLIVNASNVSIRQFKSLEIADKRQQIEGEIRAHLESELGNEKLDKSITISAVQIRNASPNQAILDSATQYVKSQNDVKIAESKVQLAKLESERMAALAQNSQNSIAYMDAQARLNISEGVKEGKVQTVVVPADFKGFVNVGK